MAVDRTLIAGAGKAAYKDPRIVKALGISKISDDMFGTLADITKEKVKLKNEFDDSLSKFINQGSYLDENVLVDVLDILQEDRKKYIWGSKKDKMRLKIKMSKLKSEYDAIDKGLKDMEAAMNNPMTKVNEEWEVTQQGQDIAGIFSGKNKAIMRPGNEEMEDLDFKDLGFYVTNEVGEKVWMSKKQIGDIVKKNSRDGETDTKLTKQVGNAIQWAASGVWGKYTDWNPIRFGNNIQSIVNEGNLYSLTNHTMAGLDGSFKDNLIDAIENQDWSEMGISAEDQLKYNLVEADHNGDGVVDRADAEYIVDVFIGNKGEQSQELDEREFITVDGLKLPNTNFGEPIWTYNPEEHKKAIKDMFLLHAERQWMESLPAPEAWKYLWRKAGKTDNEIEAEEKRRRDKAHSTQLLNQGITVN